jgi:hypothetical protein
MNLHPLLLLAVLGMPLEGEQASDPKASRPPPKVFLPGDAIVVVYADLQEALNGARPGSVILSAEQYEALLERLSKLEKAAAGERKSAFVHACRISGQVQGSGPSRAVAEVKLEIEVRTTEPGLVVPVGLKNARLTKATVDGEPPVWGPGGEGLTLVLKEARLYRLELHLQSAVTQAGQEWRLLIENLPPAAITTLDFLVPGRVASAQVVGAGPLAVEAAAGQQSRLRSEALGVLPQLDLRWQTPIPEADPGTIQVLVQADTQAILQDTVLDTETRLKLEVRQGSYDRLTFRVPREIALLQVEPEAGGENLEVHYEPGSGQWQLRLGKPLSAGQPPLELRVRTQQPFPDKSGNPLSVGLLELAEVPRKQQTGTIAIFLSGDKRVQFQPVDAFRLDPREGISGGRTPAFLARYWRQPARVDLLAEPGVALAAQAVVRPSYTLTFTGRQVQASFSWEILPKNRTACQEVELRWPAGFVLDRNSLLSGPVESVNPVDNAPELVRVRLAPRQTGRFVLKADGIGNLSEGEIHTIPLAFVHKVVTERDGRLEAVSLLSERGELRLVCQGAEVQLLSSNQVLHDSKGGVVVLPTRCGPLSTFVLRHPEGEGTRLEISSQPLRHQVRSEAEIYLMTGSGELEQRLRYRFVSVPPAEVWLRVPRTFHGSLRTSVRYRGSEGRPITVEAALTERGPRSLVATDYLDRLLPLPADMGRECEVVFQASLPRDRSEGILTVPLVTPGPQEQLAGPVQVRLWCSGALAARPLLEEGRWAEVLPQGGPASEREQWAGIVPSRWTGLGDAGESLPGWTLQTTHPRPTLAVAVTPRSQAAEAELVVSQAQLVLTRGSPGRWAVRARLRLHPVRSERVLLRLPLERAAVRLEQFLVNGSATRPVVRESSELAGHTEVVVDLLPRHLRGPVVLDLSLPWPAAAWPLGVVYGQLPALELPQADAVHQVLWRVPGSRDSLPVLCSGLAELDQAWHLGWGLRAPRPEAAGDGSAAGDDAASFSYRQYGSLAAPVVLLVPRTAWMLVLASVALVVAVAVFYLPRLVSGIVALLAVVGLTAFYVAAPDLWLGVLYGCQPGLAVAAVLLGGVWLRRQWWRRQVGTMPGFARTVPDSVRSRSSLQRSSTPSNGSTRVREAGVKS